MNVVDQAFDTRLPALETAQASPDGIIDLGLMTEVPFQTSSADQTGHQPDSDGAYRLDAPPAGVVTLRFDL